MKTSHGDFEHQLSRSRRRPPSSGEVPAAATTAHGKGRGALSNPDGRYERYQHVTLDDDHLEDDLPPLATTVTEEVAASVITRNTSPDIAFDRSINPYRGCEHGCIYCFARPTHSYLGLSPGLDFETRLYAKTNAAARLEAELRRPGYVPRTVMLGTATDPYQPIERTRRITRDIIVVLAAFRHPLAIATKGALVTRDVDLLSGMATDQLVSVGISLTTLDAALARQMEPRAASPRRRLKAMEVLAAAGVPVTVLAAPMIPFVNDHELERIVAAAASAGATAAHYTLLRLPLEVQALFREWLDVHVPDRAQRVLARLTDCHGGRLYRADWGKRMRGEGAYAEALAQRFALACRRFALNGRPGARPLATHHFRPPPEAETQLRLF